MSISKKLVTIAENQEKVYNSGGLAQCPKKTISGEAVSITDISPIAHDISVKASSKNIIPLPYETKSGSDRNGIIFTVNDDGSVTANGTSSGSSLFYLTKWDITQGLLNDLFEDGEYYTILNTSGYTNNIILHCKEKATNKDVYYYGGKTFKVDKTKYNYCHFRLQVNDGVTVENVTLYPQIEKGLVATSYTPHIDDVSTVKVNRYGKNLFLTEALDIKNYNKIKWGTYEYLLPDMPVGKYYFSATPGIVPTTEKANPGYFYLYKKLKGSGTWAIATQIIAGYHKVSNSQITIESGYDYKFWLYSGDDKTIPLYYFNDVMLEVGESATPYEPYIEPINHTPNADGTVEGVKSVYPVTNLFVDTEGVLIEAEYHQIGVEAGKQSEYDRFWDEFQENGNRDQYSYAFGYGGWTDETYNPKYAMRPRMCSSMFGSNTKITDTKVIIDLTNPNGTQKFALFYGATKLKTIRKLIVNETNSFTVSSGTFTNCTSLENVTFEGVIGKSIDFQYSSLLSKASIENIVSCLSETATGQTLTLSQTAVNNAFETSSGVADGSTSEEWINLITPKSNSYNGLWTITLV